MVARKYQTNHHHFAIKSEDLRQTLNAFLADSDEPFADSSALAVDILSRLTRHHCKAVISGDGADELFGGYQKHKAHNLAIQHPYLSKAIGAGLPLLKLLPKSRHSGFTNRLRQLQRFARGARLPARERYWRWAGITGTVHPSELLAITADSYRNPTQKQDLLQYIGDGEKIQDILYTDMRLVLPGDMLYKMDAMSMQHGLEVRTPYLDHRLVDFAFSLPDSFKIKAGLQKRILRDAYKNELPPEIVSRNKRGFEIPLLHLLKKTYRESLNGCYLQEDYMREQQIFNPAAVTKLKNDLYTNRPGDAPAQLWAILVFQHWWHKNMEH